MSATSTTDSDSSIEQKSEIEQTFENVMEELPERYEAHSKTHEDNIILIPEHTKVDKGSFGSHLISAIDNKIMSYHDFKFRFATQTAKGAGIKFWFEPDN